MGIIKETENDDALKDTMKQARISDLNILTEQESQEFY